MIWLKELPISGNPGGEELSYSVISTLTPDLNATTK